MLSNTVVKSEFKGKYNKKGSNFGNLHTFERYQRKSPIFINRSNQINYPFNLDKSVIIYIPTPEVIFNFSKFLYDLCAQPNVYILILESFLKIALIGSGKKEKRNLFESILNPFAYHTILFLNESFDLLIEKSRSPKSYKSFLVKQCFIYLNSIQTFNGPKFSILKLNKIGNSLSSLNKFVNQEDYNYLNFSDSESSDDLNFTDMSELIAMSSLSDAIKDDYSLVLDALQSTPDNSQKTLSPHRNRYLGFSTYYSLQDIQNGLNSGDLFVGELNVFSFDTDRAEVVIANPKKYTSVLIMNTNDRNRALHGDVIIVKLNPQSEWVNHPRVNTLTPEEISSMSEYEKDEDNELSSSSSSSSTATTGTSSRALVAKNSKDILFPTGVIVGIKNRSNSKIIASVTENYSSTKDESVDAFNSVRVSSKEEYTILSPVDKKLPKIRIKTRKLSKLIGKYVLIAVDDWPIDSKYPNGHFISIVGENSDWRSNIECILLSHSISRKKFSPEALACLPVLENPGVPWEASDSTGRVDLRSHRDVFSVDPPGCVDIDDAMSVHWLKAGHVEVGVHIADVTAFIQQGSPLDIEAQSRGTSVYLSNERIDMIPSIISGNMASLIGNRDRYAVTVIWVIKITKKDGTLVNETDDVLQLYDNDDLILDFTCECSWAGRTIIKSIAAMTYLQGHNLINKLNPGPENPPTNICEAGQLISQKLWGKLTKDLKILTIVSRYLKKKRSGNHALDFSKSGDTQIRFHLDSNGLPVSFKAKESLEIHETIAELMILANSTVCSLIYNHLPNSTLVRIHPPPTVEKILSFIELASSLGVNLVDKNELSVNIKSLASIPEKIISSSNNDSKIMQLLTSMFIKCMNQAKYTSSGSLTGVLKVSDDDIASEPSHHLLGHLGLGLSKYTHFTSPIRRYADIIVHRQLLSILSLIPVEASCPDIYVSKSIISITDDSQVPNDITNSSLSVQNNMEDNNIDDELDMLLENGLLFDISNDNNQPSLLPTSENKITRETINHNMLSSGVLAIESSNSNLSAAYSSSNLIEITTHLNNKNSSAKRAQWDCQNYFLCLYFYEKLEIREGIVCNLRENGYIVFIPSINQKLPCYLTTMSGQVCLDPTSLGLDLSYGEKEGVPSSWIVNIAGTVTQNYRILNNYTCKIVNDDTNNKDSYLAIQELQKDAKFRLNLLDRVLIEVTSNDLKRNLLDCKLKAKFVRKCN